MKRRAYAQLTFEVLRSQGFSTDVKNIFVYMFPTMHRDPLFDTRVT
jgi:hypothetical protein